MADRAQGRQRLRAHQGSLGIPSPAQVLRGTDAAGVVQAQLLRLDLDDGPRLRADWPQLVDLRWGPERSVDGRHAVPAVPALRPDDVDSVRPIVVVHHAQHGTEPETDFQGVLPAADPAALCRVALD